MKILDIFQALLTKVYFQIQAQLGEVMYEEQFQRLCPMKNTTFKYGTARKSSINHITKKLNLRERRTTNSCKINTNSLTIKRNAGVPLLANYYIAVYKLFILDRN